MTCSDTNSESVEETPGIDWIELLLQVVLAAIGVAVVAGTYGRRRH